MSETDHHPRVITYPNRFARKFARERARAEELALRPIRLEDPNAVERIEANDGLTFKYVLRSDGDLQLQPEVGPDGNENPHSLLTDGPKDRVVAAGRVLFVLDPTTGEIQGLDLSNVSRHFRPDVGSLDAAEQAFEARGVTILSVQARDPDWDGW